MYLNTDRRVAVIAIAAIGLGGHVVV